MKLLLLCVLALASVVLASDVVVLTPDNFDASIGKDTPYFVKFYAPWCGHCKALAPTWEELATITKNAPVKIAELDADAHKEIAQKFDVHGFPTIKWFPAGSTTAEAYNGGRSIQDLLDFVNEKLGTKLKVKKAPSAVVTLTPENFDTIVKDPSKDVIVKFYAPWCGHCKALAPKYEKAAQSLEGDNSVVLAEMDADQYKEFSAKYDISGFPTLKYFPKDNKNGVDYGAGRETEDFVKFSNENFGTERVVGGGFAETAGRIPELDALATKFIKEKEKRAEILTEAQGIITSTTHKNKDLAKVYEYVMKKVQEKGEGFVQTESARLKRMVDGGAVSKTKRGEFSKRANIVAQFVDK